MIVCLLSLIVGLAEPTPPQACYACLVQYDGLIQCRQAVTAELPGGARVKIWAINGRLPLIRRSRENPSLLILEYGAGPAYDRRFTGRVVRYSATARVAEPPQNRHARAPTREESEAWWRQFEAQRKRETEEIVREWDQRAKRNRETVRRVTE